MINSIHIQNLRDNLKVVINGLEKSKGDWFPDRIDYINGKIRMAEFIVNRLDDILAKDYDVDK